MLRQRTRPVRYINDRSASNLVRSSSSSFFSVLVLFHFFSLFWLCTRRRRRNNYNGLFFSLFYYLRFKGINRVHSNVLPLPAHFIRIARRMTLAASQAYLHHKRGEGKREFLKGMPKTNLKSWNTKIANNGADHPIKTKQKGDCHFSFDGVELNSEISPDCLEETKKKWGKNESSMQKACAEGFRDERQ